MMILYHGTSYNKGMKILESGCIKKNVERFYAGDSLYPTTDGYVYLTNHIFRAIYRGNIVSYDEKDTKLMLFQVDVEEELLEPDLDEVEYTYKPFNQNTPTNLTYKDTLQLVYSVRVAQDIVLKDNKGKYAEMVSTYASDENSSFTLDVVQLHSTPLINDEYVNDYAKEIMRELEDKLVWVEVK